MRVAEVRRAQVRLAEVRLAEVRLAEVRLAEVRLAEVDHGRGILGAPGVPGVRALAEDFELFLVGHGEVIMAGFWGKWGCRGPVRLQRLARMVGWFPGLTSWAVSWGRPLRGLFVALPCA